MNVARVVGTPFIIALTVVVALCMVSGESLWIDEGHAALLVMEPTLQGLWHALLSEGDSNLQLPLELIYLWGWEKAFGHSEFALRASNLPWLVLSVLSFRWALGPTRLFLWSWVVILTSPFVWSYMNEARPYLVVFAAASWFSACLIRAFHDPEQRRAPGSFLHACGAGLFAVCSASAAAVPWAGCMLLALVMTLGIPASLSLLKSRPWGTAMWALLLVALAGYYTWTFSVGARAAGGRTGLVNAGFILYEHLGMAGLGPGRVELRQSPVSSLIPYLPALIPAGLSAVALLACAFIEIPGSRRREIAVLGVLSVALPIGALLLAGAYREMRILGRHATPVLPILFLSLAFGLKAALARGIAGRITSSVFVILMVVSSLQLRFAPRHRKDDYREAASSARLAVTKNESVWWAANNGTAAYYGLDLRRENPRLMINPKEELDRLPEPDLIVLSKRDLYDAHGSLAAYLHQRQFVLTERRQAFEFWRQR